MLLASCITHTHTHTGARPSPTPPPTLPLPIPAPPPRPPLQVFAAFKEIASTSGSKSQDRKVRSIVGLLAAADREEAGYVMRQLQGKLRIGLAEQTVLVALAHAAALQREGGGAGGASEELAGRLESAAQVVKQVGLRRRRLGPPC